MKFSVIAAVLLVLAVPAQALDATIPAPGENVDPYKLGIRDYRRGHCFSARPYAGPNDEPLKEALWIAGYGDAATERDKKFRHRRYIEWPPKCHGPDNP